MKKRIILAIKQLLRKSAVKIFGRKTAYSFRYLHNRGRWPDFDNPKDMSEILVSKILNKDFDQYAHLVDKIAVRDYVREKGLGYCLLEHYCYWDSAENITFEQLPDKFVLKTNNGAGGKDIFVCYDKNTFDLQTVKAKLHKALNKQSDYELQYTKIKPRIICEELIETENHKAPLDYKFTCIYGESQDIMVGIGRDSNSVKISRRNLDWTPKYCTVKSSQADVEPRKPTLLDEMIRVSRILSADFDFVRVDLYEYKNRVMFGELTFSPAGGILGTYTDDAIKEYGKIYLQKKQETMRKDENRE